MGSTGLRSDGLPYRVASVPGDPDLEEAVEEYEAQSRRTRQVVATFLRDEPAVDIPIIAPRYYCDLMAWALDRACRANRWQVVDALGRTGGKPRYSSVNVAPDKWEELLSDAIVLLRKEESRLAVYVKLDPTEKAEILVTSTLRERQNAERFANAITRRRNEKKLYKGKKLECGGFLAFLQLPATSWADIAVAEDVRRAIIAHTTRFLDWAPKLEPYGVSPRRGVLLTGRPGTGKTLICKALMKESPGVTCLIAHTACLVDPMYVDDLYQIAADLSPTIVFLEDIDLVGQGRLRSHYSTATALSRLLFAMDGVQGCRQVVTVATTNWLEILDEALKDRPSRFDRVIQLDPPDAVQRRHYLDYLARRLPLPEGLIERLVETTAGMTPAQIQEVIHSTAIEADLSPDSPDYWETALADSAVAAALHHVKRAGGKVGFDHSP